MPEFQPYLDSIERHYDKWWKLYTLTDAERQEERSEESFFDFGLMVQTIVPKDEPELGRPHTKIERLPVTEGLQKYAIDHVLLVGRPGSGKSTALARFMLDLGKDEQIPVLVELRSYQSSTLELIRSSFKRHDLNLTIAQIEILLDDRKLILLIDGVNELPSESARTDLSSFRRNHSKVSMIFTTRDLSLGGNLGIEKQLEMQPLNEIQMRSFINAYLPGKADAMLGQLKDRLREFGKTPLLLWMLCSLFKQSEVIPQNLGEVFRAFTRGYEQQIKQDVVLESDRRLWFDLLKQLAAAMMQGEKPTEFRVAIAPTEICMIFAEYLSTSNPLVPRQALDDLLKHHLIQRNGELVEFRHQLIQEYYAAEWLFDRIGKLDDETLECDYLNYLKWTEPLALTLALVDDDALAGRVVERSLAVDLMLGARLAGEVKQKFQMYTIEVIDKLDLSRWLKIEVFGRTRSEQIIPHLLAAAKSPFSYVRRKAVQASSRIDFSEEVIEELLFLLDDNDSDVRQDVVIALNYRKCDVSFELRLTEKLFQILSIDNFKCDASPVEYCNAAVVLGSLASSQNSHKVVTVLLQVLNQHYYEEVRATAASALGQIGSAPAIEGLIQALYDKDQIVRGQAFAAIRQIDMEALHHYFLRFSENVHAPMYWDTAVVLGANGSEVALNQLFQGLKNQNSDTRQHSVRALGRIGNVFAREPLLKMLTDSDSRVVREVILALGWLGSEEVTEKLSEVLNSGDSESCMDAAGGLGRIGSDKALNGLLDALSHQRVETRVCVILTLGEIGAVKAVGALLQAVTDKDYLIRYYTVQALGHIGSEQAIKGLLQLLENSDEIMREVVKAIGLLGVQEAIPNLLAALKSPSQPIRAQAAESLGQIGSERAIPGLIEALNDHDKYVRTRVALALAALGSIYSIDELIRQLQDLTPQIREQATSSLIKLLQHTESKQVIARLLESLKLQNTIACKHIVWILRHSKEEILSQSLPDLSNLLSSDVGQDILLLIATIQANCKFYNYEIYQKAIDRISTTIARASPPINTYTINAKVVQIIETNNGIVNK